MSISTERMGWHSSESETNSRVMGLSVMLLWLALSKYFAYQPNFSFLTNTIQGSAYVVITGTVGTLPIIIGWSFFMTTVLYMSFRFKNVFEACFTAFYVI